ncbi:MAG: hypothetical protein K5928_05405 [Prevotella sp.]|nr:hypothetical protein [Prevotella sp.]
MNIPLVIFILVLLVMPLTAFWLYDRRMLPAVARHMGLSLLRLWLVAAVLWLLWLALPAGIGRPQDMSLSVTTTAALLLLAVWSVSTCTRRAMKVFRISIATGHSHREYLLANGATRGEAMLPFMRRAMRRTAIAALRVPVMPVMLALVAVGQSPLQAVLMATLAHACIITSSMAYVLLRTCMAGRSNLSI